MDIDDIWASLKSESTKSASLDSNGKILKKNKKKKKDSSSLDSMNSLSDLNDCLNIMNIKENSKSKENSQNVKKSGDKGHSRQKKYDFNKPVAPSQMLNGSQTFLKKNKKGKEVSNDDDDDNNLSLLSSISEGNDTSLTAEEILPRIQRDIQCTADENVVIRKKSLQRIYSFLFERETDLDLDTYEALLEALSKPIFKRFGDSNEKCRELSVLIVTNFLKRCRDLVPYLPYLLPAVMHRISQDCGFDTELQVFVHDKNEHDAFKRGKAVYRQDKNLWDTKHKVVDPSEEIRLLMVKLIGELIQALIRNRSTTVLHPYFHEIIMILASQIRDPFAEVKIACLETIDLLARTPAYELGMKFYSMGLTRAALPLFRHRIAKVKIAAIDCVRYTVAVPNREKCKGAGTEAINDMVGFRDDNVIPTSSFYRPEVQINYLAEVCQDSNGSVRLHATGLLCDWVQNLPDRYDYECKLAPYVLNFVSDQIEEIQIMAIQAISKCGQNYESDHPDDIIEKRQFGVDGSLRCNYEKALPAPFSERPRIGTRIYVRGNTRRILRPLLDELASWISKTRMQSASLLRTIVIYSEEHLTVEFHYMLEYIYKAVFLARSEKDVDLTNSLMESCELLGRYILPSTYIPLILPKIQGDVTVTSAFGLDNDHRIVIMQVLSKLIEGSKASEILPHTRQIIETITDYDVMNCESQNLWEMGLVLLNSLLTQLQGRGKAAINAHFVATGRLTSLDCMFNSAFRHLVLCKGIGGMLLEEAKKGLELMSGVQKMSSCVELFAAHALPVFKSVRDDFPINALWQSNCHEQLLISELLSSEGYNYETYQTMLHSLSTLLFTLVENINEFQDNKQRIDVLTTFSHLLLKLCERKTGEEDENSYLIALKTIGVEIFKNFLLTEKNVWNFDIDNINDDKNKECISELYAVRIQCIAGFLLPSDDEDVVCPEWKTGVISAVEIRDEIGLLLAPLLALYIDNSASEPITRKYALEIAGHILHYTQEETSVISFEKRGSGHWNQKATSICKQLSKSLLNRLDDSNEMVRLQALNTLEELVNQLLKSDEGELSYSMFLDNCFSHIASGSPSDLFLEGLEVLLRSAAILDPAFFESKATKMFEEADQSDNQSRSLYSTLAEHAGVIKMLSGLNN